MQPLKLTAKNVVTIDNSLTLSAYNSRTGLNFHILKNSYCSDKLAGSFKFGKLNCCY